MARPVSLTLTGVGTGAWKNADWWTTPFAMTINCTVTAPVTYSLETTTSDFLDPRVIVVAVPSAVTAATANSSTTLTTPIRAWRVNITAGTGSVAVEAVQAG